MTTRIQQEKPTLVSRIRRNLNDLTAKEWVQRTRSFMFQSGLGAQHPHTKYEQMHPCPFSYKDAERLITFFTRRGEKVLDTFAGVASTLKACALSGRLGTGIELNADYHTWGKARLAEEVASQVLDEHPQQHLLGDAREMLAGLYDNQFQFVLTSPPYWNILNKVPDKKAENSHALHNGSLAYSKDSADFANIADYEEFVTTLAGFVGQLRRVVEPQRYIALVVADFRDGPILYPYAADLLTEIRHLPPDNGRVLVLQGIKILVQNSKRLYPYGFPTTYVPNIHHHYILIYRNMIV